MLQEKELRQESATARTARPFKGCAKYRIFPISVQRAGRDQRPSIRKYTWTILTQQAPQIQNALAQNHAERLRYALPASRSTSTSPEKPAMICHESCRGSIAEGLHEHASQDHVAEQGMCRPGTAHFFERPGI